MLWWAPQKIHRSWFVTAWFGAVVIGLLLSPLATGLFSSGLWYVAALMVLAGCLIWPKRVMIVGVIISGCLIGLTRGTGDMIDRSVYAALYGKEVVLTARVADDIDTDKQGLTVVRLANVTISEQGFPGQLWVSLTGNAAIRRSDNVTIRGKISEGFGSFAATMYRAQLQKQVRPIGVDPALDVRDNFSEHVRKFIHEPASSLGLGYLTGQRRDLPNDLESALKIVGLTHVVVASGYNLTILVRLIKRLFEKTSRYLTMYLSLLLIGGFIAVTGVSPSMSRAGFVAVLSLGAWYFGRKFHPLMVLAFAAAVTGMINPSDVWGNLGWQLSFASFAGVMVLAPLAQSYFFGDKKPSLLRQVIGETMSAQVMTAPLILYSFGQISNVALLANLLVLPLVPLAMLLTFVTGMAAYIVPWAAQLVAVPAQMLLDYMVWVAETIAMIPWASSVYTLPLPGMVIAGGLIVCICWYFKRVTKLSLREANLVD